MGEKKCPHCGEWSSWNLNSRDTCDHCGKTLGVKDLKYEEQRASDKKVNEENWIFYIKEDDNEFVKLLKKIGNVFYVIYMSIVTFLAWLVAALPG
ncbi:hypothetical protein [Pararhodonellum marinum]|uniref:hypothetical protein n=1 Tax=Pararhodonellum marinum TaxID=2755358 RepID=UPI00188ECA56|nr:hypothetical protein [Pararhodonellum marinum]